jgi:hypothetical protein
MDRQRSLEEARSTVDRLRINALQPTGPGPVGCPAKNPRAHHLPNPNHRRGHAGWTRHGSRIGRHGMIANALSVERRAVLEVVGEEFYDALHQQREAAQKRKS